MAFVIAINGYPIESRVSYRTSRDAERAAARRFNDPPAAAPALPHMRRKNWRERGYQVIPAPAGYPGDPGPYPMGSSGHACPGGGLLCSIPAGPRSQFPYDAWDRPPLYFHKRRVG